MLVASLSLTACGLKDFPAFPDVKEQYYVDVACGEKSCEVTCVKFDIISTYPYKIDSEKPQLVDLKECQGVGGFSLEDTQKILNFTDDVQRYFESHKCTKQ